MTSDASADLVSRRRGLRCERKRALTEMEDMYGLLEGSTARVGFYDAAGRLVRTLNFPKIEPSPLGRQLEVLLIITPSPRLSLHPPICLSSPFSPATTKEMCVLPRRVRKPSNRVAEFAALFGGPSLEQPFTYV